jgi:hypothetical protein
MEANEMNTLVPVVRNRRNNFTVATVHYTADPDKANEEWIKLARQGMPERGWMREYEIDYSYFEGKAFFPEFKHYNIGDNQYLSKETLFRGWDYGFHRPAVLITKVNQFDQWCWIKALMGKDEGIMDFGKRVRQYCITHFPGALYVDVGDPAGESMSDKSEKTSVQILESLGIFVRSRKQPIKQGAEIIRQKLQMRVDGKPGIVVNKDETLLIDGFKGGLHYPDTKMGMSFKEEYEKDGYYDHIFDCGRYLATDMFTVIGQAQANNRFNDTSGEEERYRMGRPTDDDGKNPASDIGEDMFNDNTELQDYF